MEERVDDHRPVQAPVGARLAVRVDVPVQVERRGELLDQAAESGEAPVAGVLAVAETFRGRMGDEEIDAATVRRARATA